MRTHTGHCVTVFEATKALRNKAGKRTVHPDAEERKYLLAVRCSNVSEQQAFPLSQFETDDVGPSRGVRTCRDHEGTTCHPFLRKHRLTWLRPQHAYFKAALKHAVHVKGDALGVCSPSTCGKQRFCCWRSRLSMICCCTLQ